MSLKKSDLKNSDPVNSINQPSDHTTPEPSRTVTLRLVTVEQEQKRLDARRKQLRAARRLDQERRLQAVFGSWQPKRDRTTWN